MPTDYNRPRDGKLERQYLRNTGSSLAAVIGVIIVLATAALVYFTFFDRSPTGPGIVSSKPPVTAPERTAPKSTAPPANTTATSPAPSTK